MSDLEKKLADGLDKLVDAFGRLREQIITMQNNNEAPKDCFDTEGLLAVLERLDMEKDNLFPKVRHNTAASNVTKEAALLQSAENASEFESRYSIPRHRSPPPSMRRKAEPKDKSKHLPKAVGLTEMQVATLDAVIQQCLRKGHAVSRITALNWLTVSDWKIIGAIKRVAAFNAAERYVMFMSRVFS